MDKVAVFKNELRNYRAYREQIKVLAIAIDDLWYQLGGVKGVDTAKEPSGGQRGYNYDLAERIHEMEAELTRLSANVQKVDRVLMQLDDKERKLCDIYISNRHYAEFEMEMATNASNLLRNLNARLSDLL